MKKRKGFTLVELIITISIIGLVFVLSGDFVINTFRVPDRTMREYNIQSNMRLVSTKITRIVRDASATFAVYRVNHNNLTAGWNYIIPSLDRTSVVEYIWNGTTWDSRTVVEPLDGVTYTLAFDKLSPAYADNLLQYDIVATIEGETRTIRSEVEALNSLQVIDRGSSTYPANALAYRSDPRPTQVSDTKAAISFVLDKSGSMAWRMNGSDTANDLSTNPDYHSRMKKLRDEANRLIDNLATNPNIYAAIVPFDSNANGTYNMEPVQIGESANSILKTAINALVAGGGTNTGDGIRRGYYTVSQFKEDNPTYEVMNFMIILVDGVTTFYSAHEVEHPGDQLSDYTFVNGFNNIDDVELDLDGSNNDFGDYFANGRYGGYGNSLDPWGTEYVELVGDMVKQYGASPSDDLSPVKVYVIGFSSVSADYGSLQNIATATGADTYYQAGSSEALEAIFTAIQKDINDSLWHIGGPN